MKGPLQRDWIPAGLAISETSRRFERYLDDMGGKIAIRSINIRLRRGSLSSKVLCRSDFSCNFRLFGFLLPKMTLPKSKILPKLFWIKYLSAPYSHSCLISGDFFFYEFGQFQVEGSAINVHFDRNELPQIPEENAAHYTQFPVDIAQPNLGVSRGRPRGSGGWAALDEPIVTKMREMISKNPGMTAFNAAGFFADEAAGNASPERKQRRLADRYRSMFGDG